MRKILVLVLGLMLLAAACNKSTPPAPTPTPTPTPAPAPTPVPTPTPTPAPSQPQSTNVEVKITASGFEPASITIANGTTVTFINNDSKNRWPASAPHPTHTDYPEFDPKKAIAADASWTFTFDKVGTWKYHDHLNSTKYGSVTVTE
ncbi:MAG: hypothetical protein A2660_02770 [Candidatus Doudnabacteria bacterium RIFCSPHIGHO2_01_FULL_45_18]|uniref:EfeO-type cupredoxin-like domain-containing protein n=1 Tax=Candidatus Doudnabacteria bacterium RIFCSPHIGHO2_01_FULL_45_18 TaxID=1817823 RepID=A0A1F5NR23_9BACT|nr:MAG: hypothetical protein A2660_02770 [Candidatus Doudnabacteria bacterium RIFCSPHIGHO2_01_FULL_45_18]